jgi:hypothetical protein
MMVSVMAKAPDPTKDPAFQKVVQAFLRSVTLCV